MTFLVAIVGTRYPDLAVEQGVLGPLGVELRAGDGATAEALVAVAGDADVVLAGSAPRFDDAVLRQLRGRGIVRYGVGVESVDLEAAARMGLWVARVADYGTEAAATHTLALVMAGVRRLVEADRMVRAGGWGLAALRPLHAPSALTAGVVGLGRIGRRVAGMLSALGFRVVGHDPMTARDDLPAGVVICASFDELLGTADVVTLHAPGAPDGRALLDARAVGLLRPGSVLVNTARGSLIDARALAAGLAAGRPGVAALDVHPNEPPDLAVFHGVMDKVVFTPHMAWYTEESELDLRTKAAQEAGRLLTGQEPRDVVVRPARASA